MQEGKPLRYWFTLIFFVLIYSLISVDQAYAAETKSLAKLADIQGQVYVTRGGGSMELQATNDMPIFQGDWLRTGADGYVKVIFNDSTETAVDADVMLTIEELSQTEQTNQNKMSILSTDKGQQVSIKLWSGSIWNKVKSLLNIDDVYEVETPTAVMGVRGTLFATGVDPETGETSMHVVEGKVTAQQNKELTQTAEEKVISMGQEVLIEKRPEQPLKQQEINQEKFVETTSSKLLVEIIMDVSTRAEEMLQSIKQEQLDYEQTKDLDVLKKSLVLVNKSMELVKFTQQIVVRVEASSKAPEVQTFLKQENTSFEIISNKVEEIKQETQKKEIEVYETAIEEGISPEQIEIIITDKPVINPQPVDPIITPPLPTTNPPPSDNNGSSNNSNTPPQALNVRIVGTPQLGNMLQGSFTYNDAQNDLAGIHQYKWLASNSQSGTFSEISQASNLTISSELLGKYIKFEVTPVALSGIISGQSTPSSVIGPVVSLVAGSIDSIENLVGSGTSYSLSIPEGANTLSLPIQASVTVGENTSTREIVWSNYSINEESFIFKGFVRGFSEPVFLTITIDRPIVISLPIADKSEGASVTIAGATTLEEVSIKVIKPDGSLLFVDLVGVTNREYFNMFTLPHDSPEGDYIIVTGQGNIVSNTMFKLINNPE